MLTLFSFTASAGDVSVSWTAPTSRLNGTALTVSEIAGYNIYLDGEPVGAVDGQLSASTVQMPPDGAEHCVSLQTVTTDGLTSQLSDSKCFILTSAPNAPSGITISLSGNSVSVLINR